MMRESQEYGLIFWGRTGWQAQHFQTDNEGGDGDDDDVRKAGILCPSFVSVSQCVHDRQERDLILSPW
jgi:hypothetical protein